MWWCNKTVLGLGSARLLDDTIEMSGKRKETLLVEISKETALDSTLSFPPLVFRNCPLRVFSFQQSKQSVKAVLLYLPFHILLKSLIEVLQVLHCSEGTFTSCFFLNCETALTDGTLVASLANSFPSSMATRLFMTIVSRSASLNMSHQCSPHKHHEEHLHDPWLGHGDGCK